VNIANVIIAGQLQTSGYAIVRQGLYLCTYADYSKHD